MRHIFRHANFKKTIWLFLPLCTFCLTGCGNFFNEKSGEIEARATLSEIKQIPVNIHINNPMPEMYLAPAQRINVKGGLKLFYFTKHHSAKELASIIASQLGYKVTPNEATNQLIITCPNDKEADEILAFLDKVDVPPIQVNIDCLIVELYADKTMDRETTVEIENLLGEKITLGAKRDTAGNLLANFPGASLRESKRSTFGMGVGYWNRGVLGHEIKVLVDILVSRGYLKILMNPTLETINGKNAKISSRDNVPIEKVVTKQGVDPYSLTEYQWVEDSLDVTPHVFADGSIGLTTEIKIGSSSKPKGVVQSSIITDRSIHIEENRIKPGRSLIIGGLRKTEKREVLRGAPFFKDLPIVGILFSSRDFEESGTELIFILTPSISSGGIEYSDMMKEVKKKQAAPKYEPGLEESLTDPFGTDAYTKVIEQKAAESEAARLRAEAQISTAQQDAMESTAKAEVEMAEAEKAQAQAKAKLANAKKIKAQAEKSKAEAEKAKAEAEKAQVEAQKAQAEAEIAKAQAEKAKAETEKAKAELRLCDMDPNQ